MQGDEELAMGHKPGLMMDRKNASIPQQQLGFMGPSAVLSQPAATIGRH